MKILFVATVGGFMPFFKSLIKDLIDEGNIIGLAANQSSSKIPDYYKDWGCKIYDISTSRSPLSFGNIKAIKQIKRIAKEYDIVHCNTPLAAMATRFACKGLRKKQGLKVVYTAHGFHFYKGAPKKNWVVYYPVEKMCSRWTDVLITINKEDFELARNKMRAKRIEYIPGVGIDVDRFANTKIDVLKKRREIGVPNNAKLILSVGELNENKNHQAIIRAIHQINDSNIHYVIAGVGPQNESLKKLAKELNVNLHLLGYRNDVHELYKTADLYALPSKREGLNVSLLEAIASGCPAIASRIRGNIDVLESTNCFTANNIEEVADLIKREATLNRFNGDLMNFDYNHINAIMIAIYNSIFSEK